MESKGTIESFPTKNSASYLPNNMTTNHEYFAFVSNIEEPTVSVTKLEVKKDKSEFSEICIGNDDCVMIYGLKYVELKGVWYLVTCFQKTAKIWSADGKRLLAHIKHDSKDQNKIETDQLLHKF